MNFLQARMQSFTEWLGRAIQCIKDFYRPLEDLRIIVLSLLAGGFALLYLDQGRDVIRGLVDSANAVISNWPPKGEIVRELVPIIVRWVAFMLACAWSGINAWYWANLLYKTGDKGDQQQPRWFLFARRGFGVLPLLAAAAAMWLSARHGLSDVWFGMLCFAIAAGLLLWFFIYRTTWFTSENAPKAYKEVDRGKNLVQGDVWFVVTTIAVSLLSFGALLIPGWRTEFAWIVGPAALAYGAIGCIIPITSYLIWKTRSQNIPIIMLGGLAFVLFSLLNDNHRVRPLDMATDRLKRPTVEEALRRWEKGRDADRPIILVATAGGASRAAYWTGTVLRALDNRSNGQFSDHVFAISSVSGGSLGAIGYAAWLADRPMESEAQPVVAAEARLNFVQSFFGQDYLGPAVGALLFPDMVQRFLPAPILPDRAESLEEAFELGWRQSAEQCKQQPCPKPTRFAEEYTEIWRTSRLHQDGGRWVPIVLANGTHVETGKRIITAPLKIEAPVFEDTYDFYKLAPAPIRASTAVLNSARFTVVSPPGRLMDGCKVTGRIIDGGYFENGGMETVYDLARYLRRVMQLQRRIIVVEILNDDTMSKEDLARHNGSTPVDVEDAGSESRSPLLLEVTSVIGGLYHTRSARGVLGAKRISDETASGLGDAKLYSFDLRRLNDNWYTAMSWALSQGTRDAMDVGINTTKEQIEHFLDNRNYAAGMKETLTNDLRRAAFNLKDNNDQLDAVLNELKANVKPQGTDPVIPAKRK